MKKKWFVYGFIFLILSAGIGLGLFYSNPSPVQVEKVERELTFQEKLRLLGLFSLITPHCSYYSPANALGLGQHFDFMREKQAHYQKTIKQLASDPRIIKRNIRESFISLIFLEDSVEDGHDLKSLVGWASKKKLRKIIPYKARKPIKRSKKKIIRSHYSWVYSAASIRKGKEFLKEHADTLVKIEKKYGVNKEYLVAVLFVETRFGHVTGEHHVFSLYNSLYHLDKKRFVKKFYNNYLKKRYALPTVIKKNSVKLTNYLSSPFTMLSLVSGMNQLLSKQQKQKPDKRKRKRNKTNRKTNRVPSLEKITSVLDDYLDKKITMGYHQLVSLIIMTHKHGVNIHQLKGSWAGAFGLGQFIPSSFLIWARDGNNDGKIDLYNVDDSFASTANYLKKNGFKPNNVRRIIRSIFRYNYDSTYTRSIYNYAQALVNKKGRISIPKRKRRSTKKAVSNVSERIEN